VLAGFWGLLVCGWGLVMGFEGFWFFGFLVWRWEVFVV